MKLVPSTDAILRTKSDYVGAGRPLRAEPSFAGRPRKGLVRDPSITVTSTDAARYDRSTSIRAVQLPGKYVALRVELARSKLLSGTVAPGAFFPLKLRPVYVAAILEEELWKPASVVGTVHKFAAQQLKT